MELLERKLSNDVDELAKLTLKLRKAANAYYEATPILEDIEYDKLIDELGKMEKANGFYYKGSPSYNAPYPGIYHDEELDGMLDENAENKAFLRVVHEEPALSLDKVKYVNRQDLVTWLSTDGRDALGGVLSYKMDGLTVICTYDGGHLTRCETRGDGQTGLDITRNAVNFFTLPKEIPYKEHLVMRGEAVMSQAEFNRINDISGGIFENARNLVSATVQMQDAEEAKKRRVDVVAFKLVYPKANNTLSQLLTETGCLSFLSDNGFLVVPQKKVTKDTLLDEIEAYKENINMYAFPTDGLVLSGEDVVNAEELGTTGHHPRGSIAMKWTDELYPTTLRDIEWSVGKTGVITPVAIFDMVRMGLGSNVTRASVHNLSIMEKLGLRKGARIHTYLANLIIPQIADADGGDEAFKVPEVCPVCGEKVRFSSVNGVKTLHCDNVNCAARTRGMLVNAFSRDGLDVKGLGPSQIEDLQEAKLITKYATEIYTLKKRTGGKLPDALAGKDGWGEKSWRNLLDAVDVSRKTTLQRVLYSLGIPLLGHDLSKKLTGYWEGDAEKFMAYYEEPSYDELVKLDGVGIIKARNVYDWCRFTKADAVKNLMFHVLMDELQIAKPEKKAEETLGKMIFVITGDVHIYKNRDEFKASVEARGGKVSGSVSKKTDYLVINDLASTTGKAQKARELGVQMISEDQFVEKFGK